MHLALPFAAATALATTLGGLTALRTRDRLHLALGLSAGLLLGLVGFDLLPTVFAANHSRWGRLPLVSVAIVVGFLLLHVVEKAVATHEPHDSDYDESHEHRHVVGTLSALAMTGHVFLDGVGIGAAFHVTTSLGVAVTVALAVHAYSDGLNTVSFLVKGNQWSNRARWLLALDLVARVGGAALGSLVLVRERDIALYLALFTGIVIYIATSHILPEAHARHPSRMTLVATVVGVVAMAAVVAGGA